MLNVQAMHYSEKQWGDPKVFRPERFLDENRKIIRAQDILPFGQGKRLCLGEQLARASLFMYFSSMLQKYSIKLDPNAETKPTMTPIPGFTLSPTEYSVLIKKRVT